MELRATMELRVGRDKSTGKKGTPYIVWDKDPTVIHLPARGQRYYRSRPAVLPQGHAVLPQGHAVQPCRPAVLPQHQQQLGQTSGTSAEGGTSASAVLPLPLAVLPQGRIPLARE